MRQLARGVLATLILAMAACGAGSGDPAPDTAFARPVSDTALASSSRLGDPETVIDDTGSFTIHVTSPEGVGSAGLDAAVSVLTGRPDTRVIVAAPAADVRSDPQGVTTTALAPVDGSTMTGHPASVVNGTLLDTVATVMGGNEPPDLVVIGLVGDAGEGTAAMRGAHAIAERGVPVLIVSVGGDDPDLAGAALLLASVADYDLDTVVDGPGIHVLTVPACADGIVRGPVEVAAAPAGAAAPTVDCTTPDTGPFDDEIEAWVAGHATLARHGSSGGQAIP